MMIGPIRQRGNTKGDMTVEYILIIFFLGAFVGASMTIWLMVAIWLLVGDKEER